jgi:hypothetical protein
MERSTPGGDGSSVDTNRNVEVEIDDNSKLKGLHGGGHDDQALLGTLITFMLVGAMVHKYLSYSHPSVDTLASSVGNMNDLRRNRGLHLFADD